MLAVGGFAAQTLYQAIFKTSRNFYNECIVKYQHLWF